MWEIKINTSGYKKTCVIDKTDIKAGVAEEGNNGLLCEWEFYSKSDTGT